MLFAAAWGGLSDLAKELIAAGLDIKHENKVRVCMCAMRQVEMLARFGTVTKYVLVCA